MLETVRSYVPVESLCSAPIKLYEQFLEFTPTHMNLSVQLLTFTEILKPLSSEPSNSSKYNVCPCLSIFTDSTTGFSAVSCVSAAYTLVPGTAVIPVAAIAETSNTPSNFLEYFFILFPPF